MTAATIGLLSMAMPPTRMIRPMMSCQTKPPHERTLQAWTSCSTPTKISDQPTTSATVMLAISGMAMAKTPPMRKTMPMAMNQPECAA